MGVSPNAETVVRLKDRPARRSWSKQERRQIVEETLTPGASVSLVARAHDVNTNQLFKWRRQYRKGGLETEVPAPNTLLPVKISDASPAARITAKRKSRAIKSGIIDIDLGHARVRIEGTADAECVRAALEKLVR